MMNDVNAKQRTVSGECPRGEVLSDLVLGKLPLEIIDAIGQHIETCPTCQGVLESLDGLEDSVIADIKGQAGPLPPDPQLQEQIREAEQISRVAWCEPQADAHDEPLPTRVGQYEVLDRIGRGGMGTVYKARHPHLKRDVAIKVLSTGRLRDLEAIIRFQREMEAVGRLDHPNLVRAHDAGETDGQHFLVMEFLDGTDLRRLVREHGPLPVADACEVIRQAAMGLQYAHEHGLIHRDIKPSNLMLTSDGMVKVLDLGLARFADEATTVGDTTSRGQVVGTGDFISPEQGQDTHAADARSDIYSLGCTLYYLLAGKAPFSDARHNTFVQKVMAHAHEPIPPIKGVRNGVPEALALIIERMTAKAPDQRFQNAAEVAVVLQTLATTNDLAGGVSRPTGGDREAVARAGLGHRNMRRKWLLPALFLLIPLVVFSVWFAHSSWVKQPRGEKPAMSDHEFLNYMRHEMEAAQKATDEIVKPDIRKVEQDFAEVRRKRAESNEAAVSAFRAPSHKVEKTQP
jgi:serine/threonine protein kinase